MVGLQNLDLPIGVRLPISQLFDFGLVILDFGLEFSFYLFYKLDYKFLDSRKFINLTTNPKSKIQNPKSKYGLARNTNPRPLR